MRFRRNFSSLVVGLLYSTVLWISPLYSQPIPNETKLGFSFIRQNDFSWYTNLDFHSTFSKNKFSLDATLHNDNIYNTSPEQNKFVQQYLMSSVFLWRRFSKKMEAASWTETDQYLSTHNQKFNLYGGIRYNPIPGFYITPLAGYSWDLRSNILNQGFSPAAYFQFTKKFSSGADYRTTAMFRYKFIAPRRQKNFFWDQQVSQSFAGNAKILAGLRLASHELDDFSAGNVKRISSDTLAPSLGIIYPFKFPLTWNSQNKIQLIRRKFLYEPLPENVANQNNLFFEGMEINLLQEFTYQSKNFQAGALYEFQYFSRRYTLENNTGLSDLEYEKKLLKEKEKDYFKNGHKWEANMRWNFSRKSSFLFKTGSQYIQYDTPSEQNYDDRDELTYLANGEIKTNWRKNFSTSFGLTGNFRHYAFLFGERSQDNYMQRSLRADFSYVYRPFPSLVLSGDNAIYVTYNVKDFRDYGKTDRSTRNMETNIKVEWKLNSKWTNRTSINRKETQQSYLNWEAFSETTLDTNRIINIDHMWIYKMKPNMRGFSWTFEGGYRHYSQVRRQTALMNTKIFTTKNIVLHTVNLQTGPQIAIRYKGSQGYGLNFVFWIQNQLRYYRFKETDKLPLSPQSFNEVDLKKKSYDIEFYPNATIQFVF